MTDREAMAMALDALETEVSIDWTNNDEFNASAEKMHEAIAALKKQLADYPMREVQRLGQEIEQCNYPDCKCPTENPCLKGLAQPEQEPVAHCKVRLLRGDESFPKVEIDWVNQPVLGPLYATPPQRKPLTRGQIAEVYESTGGLDFYLNFARAIEAAHGIKENT
jgi:hypothetical protein